MKYFVLLVLIELISAQQVLRSEGTFDGEMERSASSIERGKAPQERINLSFPGTRWCGPGSTASSYYDLGINRDVDECCRAHDFCDHIESGQSKHGLTNPDFFARLHCLCEKEFKQCLKSVNSFSSNLIGNFYFNMRGKCYKENHPGVCEKYRTKFFIRRCIKYTVNTIGPLTWQWFDLPFYDDEHDLKFNQEVGLISSLTQE